MDSGGDGTGPDPFSGRRGVENMKNRGAQVRAATAVLWTALAWVPVARAQGSFDLRPGFNLFSLTQDVQVGRENAAQVEKQLPLLKDAEADRYVNDLGRRLAAFAPNGRPDYVWQYKVVNSPDINAFALPGGFIYVNRATIESASNEAQLAGVLAHESGHVVMRHGTHQASQMMLAQAPLAILGGMLGQNGGLMSQLAQYGIGFGAQSLLLRNSRSMESQADDVGAYVLYQAGYDPHALAQFFEIIQQKYPTETLQFFSDHPNPGNRIMAVDAEIPELGPPKAWRLDSAEFQAVKRRLLAMPPAPKPKPPSP